MTYREYFKRSGIKIGIEDRLKFKQYVLNLASQNKISFTAPSKHSRILKNVFDVEDLSTIECITITHKSRYDNEIFEN